MRDWQRANTHRSITFDESGACALYINLIPVSRSKSTICPKKNRKELSHGNNTRARTSLTPCSLKRRFSALTMGELIKNNLVGVSVPPSMRKSVYIPKSIGSVFIDDLVGVRIVFETLAHLLSVLRQHESSNDEVLPWRSSK